MNRESEIAQNQMTLRLIGLLVLFSVGMVLGFKPLSDLDLGWHLAAGLWIVENRAFPWIDPFGSQGSTWVDYSWLFQVLIAKLYQWGGFAALRSVQCLVIIASLLSLYLCALKYCVAGERCELLAVVVSLVGVILIAPIWHLRPQLISMVLFALLFSHRSSSKKLWSYALLTALWANVHVYWVLAPFLYFYDECLFGRDNAARVSGGLGALILLLCGCLSPYTFANFTVVWSYAFAHSVGYLLIREFQSLSQEMGLLFWGLLGVALFSVVRIKRLGLATGVQDTLLYFIFLSLAFVRIKFVPLFAVVFVATAVRYFSSSQKKGIYERRGKGEWGMISGIGGVLLFFGFVLTWAPFGHSLLGDQATWALDAAQRFSPSEEGVGRIVVMNDFNDAGWLILGFHLSRAPGERESRFKVAIDGRTLVAGEERLAQYQKILSQDDGWEEVLKSWKCETVLVRDAKLMLRLKEGLGLPTG